VPGCNGGGGGDGRSGIMLYHWVGISLSSRVILVKLLASLLSDITALSGGLFCCRDINQLDLI
jgi:hypothetical protein